MASGRSRRPVVGRLRLGQFFLEFRNSAICRSEVGRKIDDSIGVLIALASQSLQHVVCALFCFGVHGKFLKLVCLVTSV